MSRSRMSLEAIKRHMNAAPAPAVPVGKLAKQRDAGAQNTGRAKGHASHEVRIIGGQWKRRRLKVSDLPGLRPTADRVRETLFNWLAHRAGGELDGWLCLDAFAGTGALGLEAASRGAAQVSLVESQPEAVRHLQGAVQVLKAENVRVLHGDGVGALRQMAGRLHLVFIDPPFDSPLYPQAMAAARDALNESGLVYLEAAKEWDDEALAEHGYERVRYLKAGQVHAHLLQKRDAAPAA